MDKFVPLGYVKIVKIIHYKIQVDRFITRTHLQTSSLLRLLSLMPQFIED